jgi:hypothetical protein
MKQMPFNISFFEAPIYNTADISKNTEYIGRNNKKLLIVCRNYNESSADFLNKIMKAVNTDLTEDAALVDLEQNPSLHYSELNRTIAVEKIIFFSVDPAQIGLHLKLPLYKCTIWNDINILCAEGLEQIAADKNKKALLWRELQLMFKML